MVSSQVDKAQMESEEVERVRDLRMGERPSNAQYIKRADFRVANRECCRGGGGMGGESNVEFVLCSEDAEVECPCLGAVGRVLRFRCEDPG